MPAQSARGGSSPLIQPAANQVGQSLGVFKVSNLGIHPFFLLLLLVTSVLLAVSFFLDSLQPVVNEVPRDTFSETFPVDVAEIKFPSNFLKERYLENLTRAQLEENSQERYRLLSDNFSMLVGFYLQSHAPSVRQQAETYARELAQAFPEFYQKSPDEFLVSCLDAGCGKVNYPDEILSIIEELRRNSTINRNVADAVLRDLEAAGFSQDRQFQWESYLKALQSLQVEYDRTEDKKTNELVKSLKSFLEKNFFAEFDRYGKLFPGSFDLE